MPPDPAYGPQDFARDCCVSRETLDRLQIYADLLTRWQKAKNLVAAPTLPDLWRRHMLDSLQLAPFLPQQKALGRLPLLLDIGSGAGFPGLPLAIAGFASAHLVDSNGRKGAFLRQVSRETGVDVTVHTARIETLSPFPVDVITSRACAPIAQLLDWAAPFTALGASALFLKGARGDEELTAASQIWKMAVKAHPSRSDPSGVIYHLSAIQSRRA